MSACDGFVVSEDIDDSGALLCRRCGHPHGPSGTRGWRFDVPEVPEHVAALRDKDGDVWLRLARNKWSAQSWPGDSRTMADLLDYAPLVECPDPRGTT